MTIERREFANTTIEAGGSVKASPAFKCVSEEGAIESILAKCPACYRLPGRKICPPRLASLFTSKGMAGGARSH